MIIRHLREMASQSDPMPALLQQASSFWGDVVVAHTAGLDIETLYNNSLSLIFGTNS